MGGAGAVFALLMTAVALTVYCDDSPSLACPGGSLGFALVMLAILAVVGSALVLAVDAALRRDRVGSRWS